MSSEAAGSSLTEEKIRHYKITAWVVTIAIFLTGVSLAYAQNKVSPVIPVFMDVFSIDMTTAGWLSSVFSIVAMISALPAAWIIGRLGSRKCGLIAIICALIGSALGILSGSIEILMVVSRVIEGIGVGIISVIAPALVSMWFPAQKRGAPMGLWGGMANGRPIACFFHWG